jgi:hypothetical protein
VVGLGRAAWLVSALWPGAARRPRSSGPNQGGDPAAAFSATRPGWAVAARPACTRGSLRAPLDQGLRPGGDPERTQRLQLGRARRPAHQAPFAERARQQDTEAEVAGQRKIVCSASRWAGLQGTCTAAIRPALMRPRSSPKARRGVMGGADQADQPPVPGRLEHRQVRARPPGLWIFIRSTRSPASSDTPPPGQPRSSTAGNCGRSSPRAPRSWTSSSQEPSPRTRPEFRRGPAQASRRSLVAYGTRPAGHGRRRRR